MTAERYQGWLNYETWNVNLWLSNDEGLYDQINVMADVATDDTPRDEAVAELADDIQQFVEEIVLGDEPPTGITGDLLTHGLGMVDWREIATAWLED